MKKILTGIIIGFVLFAVIAKLAAPGLMLKERVSPLSYEETVQKIESAVTNGGWVISSNMDMQKSLAKRGQTAPRVTLLKICEPHYAAEILNDDDSMYVSLMMPCTISVYEKSDGSVYVATMNAGLMGRMFGGTVAKMMGGSVAPETAAFTAFLNQ
ncbi:DUF302 domain-containing protein [Tichowtungia aerotolerans]|uniref:DUF302 domain-containing protein n=1 Tax=Tichowtungia aerotolerans TaxID=2697043 RepID=A0A6P1MA66_9BACT|nr:DUF302 domain-containing protein [Tichowtungia aerotolerans]QHI69444.1 DUF302 domain-containing protein [Tichowtungia aerotolerans]